MSAFAQNGGFKTNKQKDAAWIRQLIEIQKQRQKEQKLADAKRDSASEYVEYVDWVDGKVVYSPDSSLRIGQLLGRYPNTRAATYLTAVQYAERNKILELKLPADTNNYDFQDYPIIRVYKLPSPKKTYLIISVKADVVGDYAKVEKLFNVATLVHIDGDSLKETGFKTSDDETTNQQSEVISGKSLYLGSYIPKGKNPPRPFLRYDAAKKEIRFLTTYCGDDEEDENKGCTVPYLHVYSGKFAYADTAFSLSGDTSYFYPSLKTFDKVITNKNFKTGKYTTKVIATEKYEEVGEGVLRILDVDYHLQSQSIGYVDYRYGQNEGKPDISPDYKVQKNSDLIFIITNTTTPNHGGRCGACDFNDSEFWLMRPTGKKLLFTLSSNTDSNYTTYAYNEGKSDRSGKLYLKNNAEDDHEVTVDKAYWRDSSTYVIRVTNDALERNYYISFVVVNGKTVAKLVIGKLLRSKGKS